jgi:hypothetical protein
VTGPFSIKRRVKSHKIDFKELKREPGFIEGTFTRDRYIKEIANMLRGGIKLDQISGKLDLDTYLSKNERFMSFIYNRREIQSIANRIGLSPGDVRAELKKRGYKLTNNGHGLMVWMKAKASALS